MKHLVFLALLLFATSAHAGEIKCVSVTPTVDTSAYATGDLIGGKLTFTGLGGYDQNLVLSATVYDAAAQAVDLDLVIFSSDPSLTTFTDQAAFDIADADLAKVAQVFNFGAISRFAFADNSVHQLLNQTAPLKVTASGANSRTFYASLISRGTPTFAASTDVTVKICVESFR